MKLTTQTGHMSLHKDGFGFFTPSQTEHKKSIFVPAKLAKGVLPGDLVEAVWDEDQPQPKTTSIKVKSRLPRSFAFIKDKNEWQPFSNWNVELTVSNAPNEAIEGDLLVATFDGNNVGLKIKTQYSHSLGSIKSFRSRHSAHLTDGGYHLNPAEQISDEFKDLKDSTTKREDWSEKCFITVDGEFTKDFDDAVCVQKLDEGWEIHVAIADVSSFIEADSPLDLQARKRGSTVYLPSDVRPMLPRMLADDKCSLIAGVKRPVLIASMLYDASGAQVGIPVFTSADIKVKRRCTFNEVEQWNPETSTLDPEINKLLGAWQDWLNIQEETQSVTFPWHRSEHYIQISEDGKVHCLTSKATPKASKMVEVAMIAANRSAAQYLNTYYGLAAFRNHEEPNWSASEAALEKEGWTLEHPPKVNQKQWWLDQFKKYEGASESWILAKAWTKIQAKASYQTENQGHHALAATAYTHFTSPIRRYADLEVHRAIRASLFGFPYDTSRWHRVVEDCNASMKRSKSIEYKVRDYWMTQWWLQNQPKHEVEGTVKAIKKNGLVVLTTNVFGSEGLIWEEDLALSLSENQGVGLGTKHPVRFEKVEDGSIWFKTAERKNQDI